MDLSAYPPTLRPLLSGDRVPELGPGKPDPTQRSTLASLTPEALFGTIKPRPPELAQCCLAGLWLLHDFLDESHTISQDIAGAEGSYWHGIMHRREPDAANAAYWFRRVGLHPVVSLLIDQAPALGYEYTNPMDFITFCERVRDTGNPDEELARRVQRLEWDLLFEHCFGQATR
jgi:hypothetical protein